MSKLRLCTNNIWSCGYNEPWWEERGMDCRGIVRAPGIVRVYSEILPDVIGLQEADSGYRKALVDAIAEKGLNYTLVEGRYTSLLYRHDKLDLIDQDYFIYPETVPNYEGIFNNANTKSVCVGVFRTKEDGKQFIFASTHLWYMGEEHRKHSDKARVYQMNYMLDRLDVFREKYNCPAIAVGDMNTAYNTEAIQVALERGYLHAHDIAVEYADERNGYHYCFPDGYENYDNPLPFEKGIDHILIAGAPEGFVRRFERYTPDYYMILSDHFPAFADVVL